MVLVAFYGSSIIIATGFGPLSDKHNFKQLLLASTSLYRDNDIKVQLTPNT